MNMRMDGFIDPRDFNSDEELVDYIIESFVKPVIADIDSEDEETMQGVAYLFGGSMQISMEEISRVQEKVGEGLSPEYVIREMTDYDIARQREIRHRGFTVHFVELEPTGDDVAIPDAEELQRLYDQSP